jgi:hypothetical protein
LLFFSPLPVSGVAAERILGVTYLCIIRAEPGPTICYRYYRETKKKKEKIEA